VGASSRYRRWPVSGVSTDETARVKALKQENRELRRTNEVLRRAAGLFEAELERQQRRVVAFVDANRGEFGVEPICTSLQVPPSTYYTATAQPRSARAALDAVLGPVLR